MRWTGCKRNRQNLQILRTNRIGKHWRGRGKIARICAVYKAYFGEPAWKATGDGLQRPYYMSRVDHDWKIRNKRQRTDIGKYSFVNRTNQLWNKLPLGIGI